MSPALIKKEEIKTIDNQGRLVIPKKWLKEHVKDRTVKLEITDGEIIIKPYEVKDISDLFDTGIPLESDGSDWHEMKRELILKGLKKEGIDL
ncbi:MAG: AbrB/MazE/SpoVT family DNA-binding domain-containing protein [Methanobacterium sp.]|jgi:bifunctional DNA-binding transcriptional regulator/antitoxin component of YhaV-PrlF toxin-antitoxin module